MPKAQICKIIQSEGFLASLLSKLAGPLMKKTLAPLGITTTASVIVKWV